MKVEFKWTDVKNDDLTALKKILGREVLLSYPNFIEIFIIHNDTRKTHIGWEMIKNGKPIAFYSRKLNPAQIHYTAS